MRASLCCGLLTGLGLMVGQLGYALPVDSVELQEPEPDTPLALENYAERVTLFTQSIHVELRRQFNANGALVHEHARMQLSLGAQLPVDMYPPQAFQQAQLTRVLTVDGRNLVDRLRQRADLSAWQQFDPDRNQRDGNAVVVPFHYDFLMESDTLPQGIALVEGRFRVRVTHGDPLPAQLDLFQQSQGEWIQITDFPGERFRIQLVHPNRYRLECSPGLIGHFQRIDFFQGERTVRTHTINRHGEGSFSMEYVIQEGDADIDAVQLWFYREVHEIEVPFVLTDIDLFDATQEDDDPLTVTLLELDNEQLLEAENAPTSPARTPPQP